MGRIGSMPSVPDEFVANVSATSWALTNTERDHTIVVRAEQGQLVTDCPSCRCRLVIDVVGRSNGGPRSQNHASSVGTVMRFATPVAAGTPLAAATELLADVQRRILAVVDDARRPLGVLTSAQLLFVAHSHTADELVNMTALDASSPGGALLPETTRLDVAARELEREDRDFALVVDADGTLVGVLLATDFLSVID